MLRAILVAAFLATVATAAVAQSTAPYKGRAVADIIDEFREKGVPFAYSSSLVTDELLATVEPAAGDPESIVRELLEPHGLTLVEESGVLLVVRAERRSPEADERQETVPVSKTTPEFETIVVSGSRYEIGRDISTSRVVIDQRTIQNMPDIGEDPLRVAHRLPGAAASGASAQTHFRGGEKGEIGIMLNGQPLFDPFHIRDYQNIFSAIDARAIRGVEIYTGGFPVRYGDRMSGLVLMESLELERPRKTEIGISVFNTSALTAGSASNWNWLVSARRGNLDLVIDPKFGSPTYADFFVEIGYEFNDHAQLSFNALYADDQVRVVLETDPEELEQIVSSTRNAQVWLQLDSRWSLQLTSSTVLSLTDYSNRRIGELNDSEKIVATITDNRGVERVGFRQDWAWNPAEHHLVQWGLQASYGEAIYDYGAAADYFGLPAMFEGQPASVVRTLSAKPRGGSYAAYVSDRWEVTDKTLVEWGLRWDDQTYTDLESDAQLSPRFSVLQKLGKKTDLRFSWGRYYQSQGIQELQIEDGVDNFWPAQRADHLIAGIQHAFGNDMSLRVEVFHKDLDHVRPRFENLHDPLGLIPELQPDRVRLSPDSGRSQGLEVSLAAAPGKWNWWAQYTLSEATDRIDGRDEHRSWDQRHAVQGGFGWTDQSWTFALAASAHTGWPTTGLVLIDDAAVPGLRNALRHNTFATLDFRLSRRWQLRKGTLLVFLEVSNATNRRNECCLDWDVDEDADGNDVLELSRDYWMPLLPAIGVLWEF